MTMSYANLMYTFYYRSPGKEFSWSQKQIKRIDWQNLGTFWIEDFEKFNANMVAILEKNFVHFRGFSTCCRFLDISKSILISGVLVFKNRKFSVAEKGI